MVELVVAAETVTLVRTG